MSTWLQLDAAKANPIALTNTSLVACFTALGVPYWSQNTFHKKEDSNFLTWNLADRSASYPELETRRAVEEWYKGKLRLTAENNLSGWKLYLALGMMTLETRSLIIEASLKGTALHLILCPGNFTRLIRASERTASYDLLAIAKSHPHGEGDHIVTISSRKLVYAATQFGFPVLGRTEDGSFRLPSRSHTFPELLIGHLTNAAHQIQEYNEQQCAGIARNPPYCDLPGYPAGFHPFQQCLQMLYNYEQNMAIVKNHTPTTLFLQDKRNRQRAALVRVDSPDTELLAAVKHTGEKI